MTALVGGLILILGIANAGMGIRALMTGRAYVRNTHPRRRSSARAVTGRAAFFIGILHLVIAAILIVSGLLILING